MVNISVLYEEDKAAIKGDLLEMKNKIYPEVDMVRQSTVSVLDTIPSKCQLVAQYLKTRAEKAKQQIDQLFEEAASQLREMERQDVQAFTEHIAQIDDIMSNLQKTASIFESQLHMRYESDLILFRRSNPGISSLKTIPDTLKYSPPFVKGGKSDKSKLSKFFGELQASSIKHAKVRKIRQKSNRAQVRVALVNSLENILSIPSSRSPSSGQALSNPPSRSTSLIKSAKSVKDFKRSFRVLTTVNCVSPQKAWLSGQHPDIKLMDLESGECEGIPTDCTANGPSGMAVNKDGDIIYSNFEEKSVTKLVIGTKDITTLFHTDWNPKDLCIGNQDEVFVCLVENNEGKVGKFSTLGQLLVEFVLDDDGNRLFEEPSYICTNCISDICISDTRKHAIIVLDTTGRRKFEYRGSDADDRSLFDPRGIDTDSDGNIIVVDYGNSEILVISSSGEFLAYLLDRSDGLSRPCDISLDKESKLWVAECRTGKLKVFQTFSSEM
jgi:DNA-binding beta-propeller fold protein YncE